MNLQKRHYLLTILLTVSLISSWSLQTRAQFSVGERSLSYVDGARNDREVTCRLFYPSVENGIDVAMAGGEFPVIVFGHGFLMNYDAYDYLWEDLVPQGIIIAFATTETGLLPSHEDFGIDLSFIAQSLSNESNTEDSFLFNTLNGNYAVAGHSMGGGASVLGASAMPEQFDAYIGLAAAETTPSAINAASDLQIPSLIIAGSADQVTPPEEHQIPIYDALNSECKLYVGLLEGSHCYFAESGSLCDLGEFNPGSMDRNTQHDYTLTCIKEFLNGVWMEEESAFINLINILDGDEQVEINQNCLSVSTTEVKKSPFQIYPNPFQGQLEINSDKEFDQLRILSLKGKEVFMVENLNTRNYKVNLSEDIPSGIYVIEISFGKEVFFENVIKKKIR